MSNDAKTRWEMPKPIAEAKILGESADTIDLEIVFFRGRQGNGRVRQARNSPRRANRLHT
jgi:hypothetical protein